MDEVSEPGGPFDETRHRQPDARTADGLPDADLRAILDATGQAMLLVSRPERERPHPLVLWWNHALEALTGFAGRDLAQARLRLLRAGDPTDPAFAALLNALAAGESWSGELLLATARREPLRVAARSQVLGDAKRCLLILEPVGRDGLDADLPSVARMLGDLVAGGLYRLAADIDGGLKLEWADPAVERLTGYALPELQARGGLSGLVVPRDRARIRRRNLDLMSGIATETSYRLRTAGGSEIRLFDRARPLRGGAAAAHSTGVPVDRAVGTLRLAGPGDEPRQADLPPSGFRPVAELLGAAILAVDSEACLLWAVAGRDEPLFEALGEQGSGPLDGILGDELLAEWQDRVEQALSGGRQVETSFRWPASGQSWQMVLAPATPDTVLLVIRPQAQVPAPPSPAEQSDDPFLRLVLDQVSDGVLVVDEKGIVRRASQSAERIFNLAEGGLLDRPVAGLFLPSPLGGDARRRSGADDRRQAVYEERTAARASGELVPVEVATAPMTGGRQGSVLIVRDITLRKQTEETIRNLAYTDPLTALPNRLLFLDRLGQAIERAKRTKQQLAVMMVDLDRFKLINESLGLDKGDRVLRAVAMRIGNSLRKSDTVARPGSDEFLILALATDGAEGAAKVAQKTLDSLQAPFQIAGDEPTVAASIGISLFPFDGDDPDQLLKNAGTALARAKEQGSHSYQFYTTDMNAKAYQRLVLESRLRKAVDRDELQLHFQPLVELASGRIAGVEALLRWSSPELGPIPPSDFIPIAEETGLILPIGEWVLRQAVAQMRDWHGEGLDGLRIAVNISARQFQARDFVAKVRRILGDSGFPGPCLELELTESSIMRDVDETVHRLHELAEMGVRVTVDDFGTGYSSLAYLKRFPIGALKIDRSFVADVTTDQNDAAIARAVVALAETLKVRVVGEGVETQAQFDFLRSLGCDEGQGYLIGRPMPAADAFAWLKNGSRPPG
ncbi:EAL domain-containing protein [Geminicoccus roseus]|uniref:EAL domain-containing protein n=1 Tax=Geminicoccus roseus TaxID=404900 RepID=UPI000423C578|nr:EAL domain-containing protein [Geminicoccus roseus]